MKVWRGKRREARGRGHGGEGSGSVRDDPRSFRWRANFVLALPAMRRVVAAARAGDGFSRLVLAGVVLATVLTSGVLLDRTATEQVLAFRPWGLLGLLLVVVEFSASRPPRTVRGAGSPG